MSDELINRIQATPFRSVSADAIRVASPVEFMVAAAPDRKLDVGLLIEAPAPLGSVRVSMTSDDLERLHGQLASFVRLDAAQMAALIERFHGSEQ